MLKSSDPLRILIVDDNPDVADSLLRLLVLCGCRVMTASTSRGAIEMARLFRPRVALLDIGLPDMDGNQLAAALRRDESLDDLLLIAISAFGQEEALDASREAGFDHYFVKPISLDRLLPILSSVGSVDS
jgi:CheY-like chemotaxis protein